MTVRLHRPTRGFLAVWHLTAVSILFVFAAASLDIDFTHFLDLFPWERTLRKSLGLLAALAIAYLASALYASWMTDETREIRPAELVFAPLAFCGLVALFLFIFRLDVSRYAVLLGFFLATVLVPAPYLVGPSPRLWALAAVAMSIVAAGHVIVVRARLRDLRNVTEQIVQFPPNAIGTTTYVPQAPGDPNQGPGGPILVITSPQSLFGAYYAEILRTEGLNAFSVASLSTVTSESLAAYDVAILARSTLTATQVAMFADWVQAGGDLIAMDPDPQLASLLGVSPSVGMLSNGYLRVDSGMTVGAGAVSETIQFHGIARLRALSGATSLAALYSTSSAQAGYPAVTLHSVGVNGGQAASFAFDPATSIVYTRQGNPAWTAQERDGLSPIRSDDLFYGNASFDPQPDWIDPKKIAIPQADELQRLLANIIIEMTKDRQPLPRFWYLPNGYRAVVVLTGDDHAIGPGPIPVFERLLERSPSGCSLADWDCPRMTTYLYANSQLTTDQANDYAAKGFEVASHVSSDCQAFTPESLADDFGRDLGVFAEKYPELPAPATVRYHCVAWSDWSTGAKQDFNFGIRLDTNYYYWPPDWVKNRPGHFTGSAMPMRFADRHGKLIDVYQAVTQMTDESGQTYPHTADTLLDRALGAEQQYGAYTVNAHTDKGCTAVHEAVIKSALDRGVPIVTSRQLLNWLDARNASSFSALSWNGSTLQFSITVGQGAIGLLAMIPRSAGAVVVNAILRGTTNVPFEVVTVKGIDYAVFPATAGTYTAAYDTETAPPRVTARTTAPVATGRAVVRQESSRITRLH